MANSSQEEGLARMKRLFVLTVVVTFFAVAAGVPALAAGGRFSDDDGSVHEADIEAVAAAGITRGCNPPDNDRFCPDDPVTRAQMAAFLTRALELPGTEDDLFVDDDNNIFQEDIESLAAAGITRGCNPPDNDRFCPDDPVTRAQMAAFLTRGLNLSPDEPPPVDRDCDHSVSLSTREIDGAGNFRTVQAGDLVCLQAGTRQPIDIRNLHGSPGNPIIISNSGGVVSIDGSGEYSGIQIEKSSFLRVTGSGTSPQCGARYSESAQRCGIRIANSDRGVTGRIRTDRFEVDHIEMHDISGSGISVRDDELGRGEWLLTDASFHENYLRDIGNEGMYIGSSFYESGEDHLLEGIHVTDNLVVRTGRDGLQVGSAVADCTISSNVVRQAGLNDEASHRAGIMNNKGSVCDITDNLIFEPAGWGIFVQGNGGNRISNNVIVRSGQLVADADSDGDGIAIHRGSNIDRSIHVWNNTVVGARGDGIGFHNDAGTDNQIINNIIAGAGGDLITGRHAHEVSHNLTTNSPKVIDFVSLSADDFRLDAASPAVDAGLDLGSRGLVMDHNGTRRPLGGGYDIGAFESH